jgi:hypothetical protein
MPGMHEYVATKCQLCSYLLGNVIKETVKKLFLAWKGEVVFACFLVLLFCVWDQKRRVKIENNINSRE